MLIDLDKTDLVNLVRGINPPYEVFEVSLVKQCGSYTGGFNDRWDWRTYDLEKLTESQLVELYKICKSC